ncbi:sideroflexin-1 [Cimex lectularius]|uniref:Sidoreflexin n=1 Tax=Cimex lectularius TaxID=79782 RepID=A0A8I6TJ65_CIMLE|nr:sideroflexin-1 [Cimex lectularius]
MTDTKSLNLEQPRWDQSTYLGRAKHFLTVTNPLNLRYSDKKLNEVQDIVKRHRSGEPQKTKLTVDELWKAKHIYDSAFHPVTGEKTFILGRMSAQVPMNMIITGSMMTFYKSTPAVVFWQWINQSFNALVNYCNRSDADMPVSQIATSYMVATTGAVGSAVALNRMVKKMSPIIGRFVPFAAVATANCVNIPAMRQKELTEGIKVFDANNNVIGYSKAAAFQATTSVVISRILMAAPSMAITPVVMNICENKGLFKGKPFLEPVVTVGLTGLILAVATPLACALFVQMAPIKVDKLEDDLKEKVKKACPGATVLYYNKGL